MERERTERLGNTGDGKGGRIGGRGAAFALKERPIKKRSEELID